MEEFIEKKASILLDGGSSHVLKYQDFLRIRVPL